MSEPHICPICERVVKRLVSDHCHATGEKRQRICALCNSGLGMFKDNPDALRRAADYLEYWKATIESDDLLAYVQGRRNDLAKPSDNAGAMA